MSQLEQARAHRDRMHAQLVDFRENHAAKALAFDAARTAVINHRDRASATQAELEQVSAELARVVVEGAAESVRAPLRNRAADLRSAIDHHQAEAARIEPTLPDMERNFNSTAQGLMAPQQQYAVAHFEALAHEWVAELEKIAPLWHALRDAAKEAGREMNRHWSGLALDTSSPKIANLEFPDFPRG
jgi:hypothetical protein